MLETSYNNRIDSFVLLNISPNSTTMPTNVLNRHHRVHRRGCLLPHSTEPPRHRILRLNPDRRQSSKSKRTVSERTRGYRRAGRFRQTCKGCRLGRCCHSYIEVPEYIDLAKTCFLHGAGAIRHMLLMARGGESTCNIGHQKELKREILRSVKEICSLGVLHEDLRPDNILWDAELRRALIIDFHWAKLDRRPKRKRMPSCGGRGAEAKTTSYYLLMRTVHYWSIQRAECRNPYAFEKICSWSVLNRSFLTWDLLFFFLRFRLGLRPPVWKVAKGILLRKPNKPGYTAVKAYRVISLLNCLGKVVEKIAADAVARHCETTGVLHQGQMGSRKQQSAIDAVACLIQNTHEAWKY